MCFIEQAEALQERPNTPELHQQESHVFSDLTHPTDTSPSQSPPQQESSQIHNPPPDQKGHSYPEDDSQHDYYTHTQSQPLQDVNGMQPSSQDGQVLQQTNYMVSNQAGQDHNLGPAPREYTWPAV